MARKNPSPPNSTRSFLLGVAAAVVVVALALVFVLRREPQPAPAPSVDTAVQNTPSPSPQPVGTTLPDPTEDQLASVRRVTVDEVLKAAPEGIVIIDVRESASYLAAHIDGALHIPPSFLLGESPYLPKERLIVTYCT